MMVSITMVRALVAAAERCGVRRERLLAAAGLDTQQLADPNGQISLAEFSRLRHAALELSKDPAFGLHMVEQVGAANFALLGQLTSQAATLRQALATLIRYASLITPGPPAELHESGRLASVRFAFPRTASARVRFAAELTLSGLLHMLQWFVGPEARPRGVYFAYEAPEYRDEYARVFGGRERFSHAFTGIEFERAWLDRTQLHENEELYSLLQSQAERALVRGERDAGLAERVKAQLAAHDPRQMPTMEAVARALGMSGRSLRRRLVAEGIAYRTLVEQVLASTAKRMLEDPRGSIQEVSYALGFAAPAAFHRAFKRWTGITPKQYRARY